MPKTRLNRRPSTLSSSRRKHRPDYALAVIAAILLAVGLVVVYSISPGLSAQGNVPENYYVSRQAISILVGVAVFAVAAHTPLKAWRKLVWPLVILAGLATLFALLSPLNPNYPARRWVILGDLSFQSVELVKFALIIWLSSYLAIATKNGRLNDYKKTLKPLLVILLAIAVVVALLQSDLGSAAVIMAVAGAMVFVAGVKTKRILAFGCIVAAGLAVAILSSPYRLERVTTFINPAADCQNVGYQVCQALIAVGSGGMWGRGLAHGVQGYGYLPEAVNDSIFAIYAEKFGFVGVVLLLGLFVALFVRLKSITEKSPDKFVQLIMVGIVAWLGIQTIINVGAMAGLLPLKGITLPLVSYGGTSIIFVMAAIGLAFNISRYTTYTVNTGETDDNSSNRRWNGRAYNAHISRSS